MNRNALREKNKSYPSNLLKMKQLIVFDGFRKAVCNESRKNEGN